MGARRRHLPDGPRKRYAVCHVSPASCWCSWVGGLTFIDKCKNDIKFVRAKIVFILDSDQTIFGLKVKYLEMNIFLKYQISNFRMSTDVFHSFLLSLWRTSKIKFMLVSMNSLTNCETPSRNPLQEFCTGFPTAARYSDQKPAWMHSTQEKIDQRERSNAET